LNIICVIPARFQSSRFPGKPLAKIANYPMIEWVYKRANSVKNFDKVIVATDDERILECVKSFNGEVELTPSELPSGTDRVAYVAKNYKADILVNLQGDEPLISPQLLSEICAPFSDENVQMVTAIKKVKNVDELTSRGAAWVVVDKHMDALYFSRAVLPVNYKFEKYDEWLENNTYYEHVGIYAYRDSFLQKLTILEKGKLEAAEDLEQLRVLENGYKIRCILTDYYSVCVDNPEDVITVENIINQKNIKLDEYNEKV